MAAEPASPREAAADEHEPNNKALPPHHKRSFRRDAFWAFVIVVALEVLTLGAESMPWWERYTWPFHDLLMRSWRGEDIRPETAQKLAFIDIDDDAFDLWGTGGVTNRARVADLIRFAARGGARLIIVDLDLSHPDLGTGSGDTAFRTWLRDYHSGPNLIFVRPLGPKPPKPNTAWEAPPTLIDSDVAGNRLIHFATAAFTADSDGSIRRWRLWEVLCEDSKPVALPSVELLTVAIMDDPDDGATKLAGILNGAVRGQCDQVGPGMARERLTFKNFPRLELYPDAHGGEILYTQPWPVLQRADARLSYMPALPIVEMHPSPSTDQVRDRIVVIGGSNAAGRDLVQTPIGAMPGALVLLNSVNALMQQGQLSKPPPWLALAIGVTLGMGVWFILYVFQFAIALFLAAVFVFVATWVVASLLIGYGIWLDMAVPSFGMLLHRWVTVIETILEELPEQRWRALLTERFRHRSLMLALLFGLACSGAAHADPVVAGHISAIDGDTANCFVERGGHKIPAEYWANVFDGDKIIVTGNSRVEIAPDGPVVTRALSPATIKATHPSPLVQAISQKFGWILNEFSDQEPNSQTRQAMSKGLSDAMALPLLAEPDHQRIVAGTRQLTLAWVGGTAPFTTTLATAGGALTLTPAANGDQRASAMLQLGVGRYEVRVTDAKGNVRLAQFDVVGAAPAIDDTGFADAPDDVRMAMDARQLAKADSGHWRLEAFMRLSGAPSNNRVAQLLADRLAAGRSLEDPNK